MSPLRDVTIFQDLPAAYLARLEAGGRLVEPHDGVELFTQGDPGDAVFAIVGGEGQVRVGVIDRRSKRLMAEVLLDFRKDLGWAIPEVKYLRSRCRNAQSEPSPPAPGSSWCSWHSK